MTPPKEYNKLSVTEPREMEIQELLEKELKIVFLIKLSEQQENTDNFLKSRNQYRNKIRSSMNC